MPTITATEQGRNLILTVGDDLTYQVRPVNIKDGRVILNTVLAMYTGVASDQLIEDAYRLAVGDTYDATTELRWEERSHVINAALFWQAEGGGIDVVNRQLEAMSIPKAVQLLVHRTGYDQEPRLKAWLASIGPDTASGQDAQTAPTPDTASPEQSEPSSPHSATKPSGKRKTSKKASSDTGAATSNN